MGSKWNGLKSKIPAFEQPQDFQAKVNEVKKLFAGYNVTELARAFSNERREKQDLEARVKMQNISLEALSQLLVENLESQELQKIQLETGETCFLHSEPFASVIDKSAVLAWIKKRKLQSLLGVHWSTFNAFIKEMIVEGKPLPPGTSVYLRTSARIRNGNQTQEEKE